MINIYPNELPLAVQFASNDRPLTAEEKAALLDELTNDPAGRGYAEYVPQSLVSLIPILANEYNEPNPEAQGMVQRMEWKRDQLYNKLLQMSDAGGFPFFLKLDQVAAGSMEGVAPGSSILAQMVRLTLNGPLDAIVLSNAGVAQGLGGLLALGLLSQEQYDEITQIPDPNWQNMVHRFSRLDAIGFGAGAVVSLRDIEEVLA